MGMNILFFGMGLIVGWNLFPQPAWVKSIYDKVVNFINTKILKKQQ